VSTVTVVALSRDQDAWGENVSTTSSHPDRGRDFASLLTGLAVVDSTGATTPEDTIAETSVAAVSDNAADTSTATPGIAEVEVLPPDEPWAGVNRAEWTARAWQWWLSLPEDVSPNMTGEGCGYGQAGPVFLLPIPYGEVLDFECVVAEGAAIYATVFFAECSTTEPPPYFARDEDELRACTSGHLDGATNHATINGQEVADLEAYRLASPAFPLTLSEGNLNLAEPGVALSMAESYNFIIAPPSPGDYEIVVRLGNQDSPEVVATYTVMVEAPQVLQAPPTT
jgi:hypothetical protein